MAYNARQLTPDDWAEWRILRLESLKENPEAFGASYEEESAMGESFFRSRLQEDKVFGLFDEKNLIGTMALQAGRGSKMAHKVYLWGVHITSDHRGRNAGGSLLAYVIDYAKKHFSQISCNVTTTNRRAKNFYEKHGFTVYGTQPDSLRVNDKSYDELFMVKRFD